MAIPKGKNNLGAKKLFQERELYDKEYPVKDHLNINPIDLWNDHKLLYGRVDLCGNPIYLHEGKLREISSGDTGPIFTVDIVEEAFQDIQNSISKAVLLNRLDVENSKIFPLKPVRTWRSPRADYHEYMNTMYSAFVTGFVDATIDKRIVDYDSFEKEFLAFYKLIHNKFIFTFTGFITSKEVSPLISGLMIEFSDSDHGNDTIKYKKYIQDPDFNFYKDIIKRHGFVIDKHAPWRIIADLESPPIKGRIDETFYENQGMEKPGRGLVNLNGFFKNYYLPANYLDLNNMIIYMHKMWDSFAALNPVITNPLLSNCGPGVVPSTIQRQRISLGGFKNRYGRKHWLKFYIKIRNIETQKNLPDQQLKLVIKNALDIFKYKGYKVDLNTGFVITDKALDYIQQIFGGFNNQTRETKPLTEQEIIATINNIQIGTTTTGQY